MYPLNCLSCKLNLLDVGHLTNTSSGSFVSCTKCQSVYSVMESVDPFTFHSILYLVPVKMTEQNFNSQFFKSPNPNQGISKQESEVLKEKIRQVKTPREFLKALTDTGEVQ